MSNNRPAIPLWRVHLLMTLASLLVATSFTVGAAITRGMDPILLTLIRFLIAALCFVPYLRRNNGLALPPAAVLLRYGLISGCISGFFWCMFVALRFTNALNTAAIFTLVPAISSVYGLVLVRERLEKTRLLALFLGMVGALWIIFRGDWQRALALDLNYGDLLFLAGCFLMAFYTPLVKRFYNGESMVVMTFWILVTGIFWLLLPALPPLLRQDWSAVTAATWLGIVYLAVFCSIVTFFLTQFAVLHLGSTRVMSYSYLYPIFVLLLDWLFGHGLPNLATMVGVVLVLAATVVVQGGAAADRR